MSIPDGFGFISILGSHLYSATVLFQSDLFTNFWHPNHEQFVSNTTILFHQHTTKWKQTWDQI